MPEIRTPEIIKNLKDKKFLGVSVVGFLSGAGSAAALRFAVRTALGGGAGIAIGAATGAITGGTIEGIRAYRRELERVKKEGPASKEKLQSIAEQISAEKEPGLKSKLNSYLEMIRREEEGTLIAEFTKPKQKLYEELKNELKLESVRKKEVMKGILTGAVVGGLGGAVGGYLSSFISDYFIGSGVRESLREELLGAGRGAKEAGKVVTAEVLGAKIDAASSEVYQKTYEKALAAGINGLKEQTFTASAEKGEGLTHVARKLIHDYIVQEKVLGEFPDLAKSQLVYAEDSLRRMFEEGAVSSGDAFTADGKDIADIIAGAQNLSETQLQNLDKEWVPMISENTWEKILDYGEPHNAVNNFSESIINDVKGQAASAARTAAEEAGRNLAVKPTIS
ncbi:MAG: hypothetical protein Q8Q97_00510, partial [bacterium]|nr:hypothetical protein [bacterium]